MTSLSLVAKCSTVLTRCSLCLLFGAEDLASTGFIRAFNFSFAENGKKYRANRNYAVDSYCSWRSRGADEKMSHRWAGERNTLRVPVGQLRIRQPWQLPTVTLSSVEINLVRLLHGIWISSENKQNWEVGGKGHTCCSVKWLSLPDSSLHNTSALLCSHWWILQQVNHERNPVLLRWYFQESKFWASLSPTVNPNFLHI